MAFHCSVNLVASLILAGLSSAVFTMRMRPLGLGRGESRSEDESVSLIMVHMVKGGSLQHATLTSFYLQLSGEHLCVTANERVRERGRRNVGGRQMKKKNEEQRPMPFIKEDISKSASSFIPLLKTVKCNLRW